MPVVEVAPTYELSFDEALGIWLDIERAKEGLNSYGGDVAEIYAYRLLPKRNRERPPEDQARIAGRNLTRILRTFVEICPGISFEIDGTAVDLTGNGCPPFTHRVHLHVSQAQRLRDQLAEDLCAVWDRAYAQDPRHLPQPAFTQWVDATQVLLQALGRSPR